MLRWIGKLHLSRCILVRLGYVTRFPLFRLDHNNVEYVKLSIPLGDEMKLRLGKISELRRKSYES